MKLLTVFTSDNIQAACAFASVVFSVLLAIRDATQRKEIKQLNGLVEAQQGQLSELMVHSTIMRESNELLRRHNELYADSANRSVSIEERRNELSEAKMKLAHKPFFSRDGSGFSNQDGRINWKFKNIGERAKIKGIEVVKADGIQIRSSIVGGYVDKNASFQVLGEKNQHGIVVSQVYVHFNIVFQDNIGHTYKQSFKSTSGQQTLADPVEVLSE